MRILKSLTVATCLLAPMAASAVTMDGIRSGGEYSNTFAATWHNDHEGDGTAYGDALDLTTDIYWEQSGTTFYMYIEVPLYAKNMMWGTALINDAAEMDAYFYNNTHYHHGASKAEEKAQFKTMTGSERITWGGDETHLDLSDDESGADQVVTSLDWVLANGCTEDSCDRKDIVMGFEFRYDGFSESDRNALIAAISDDSLVFHLSDERQGDLSFVPIPGAAWLFGSAMLGLAGISRRKRASA